MQEKHVFIFDQIPMVEMSLRGGEGLAQARPMLNPSNPPLPGAFRAASVSVLPPGCSVGTHQHINDGEVYIIIDGEATYIDGKGNRRKLKAGDVTFCYPGESHGLVNESDAPVRMAGIIVE
ncbi:cupin domain-containing protein [Desulfovibrio sp. OttesenSCG-928-C14]|nr:cupin domain-containing protein [Desulfovibrio sp. OttesenSCG-928-C14]